MTDEQIAQRVEQTQSDVFTFEKANKMQIITKEQLSRSIRRETGLAGIRAIPAQYWTVYRTVLDMLISADVNFDEKDIYVQNNSSKAYLTDIEKAEGYNQKEAPIQRWRFDKIISTIQIPGLVENSEEGVGNARNAAIGLSLNKEGLTVAFGMNVWACTNFNVMGGTLMHSYGSGKREGMPWDVMRFRMEQWIAKFDQIWKVQNEIMEAMKGYTIPIDLPIVEEVIGDLYIGALNRAYFKGDPVPFNTYELSEFVQESIRQRNNDDSIANVWDLYNWGTSIMKPGKMDIGEISVNSNMWADHLVNRFELDVPVFEAEIVD